MSGGTGAETNAEGSSGVLMCGRYALSQDSAELALEFAAVDRMESTVPDYNITPTKTVPIVVRRSAGSGTERSVRPVRWGFIPTWARDPTSGPLMINARSESITTKPAYAEAVSRRRCLMPATGWYEWDRRRQPYLCTREDGATLAMAAVFSAWWSSKSSSEPREPLITCAVVTTAAAGEFADVHHRMPLVVPERSWDEWLDPHREDVDELLAPPGDEVLDALELRPVSPEVNAMRDNHAGLLERVEPKPEQEMLLVP